MSTPFTIVGGHRVKPDRIEEYLALTGRLNTLLTRPGSGLKYRAVVRSVSKPGVFGGVTVWRDREAEQRMVNDPERLALVARFAELFEARMDSVVGDVIYEFTGDTGS